MCQSCIDNGLVSIHTVKRIEAFLEEWPKASFGPAHIVLDDWNLETDHINWCKSQIAKGEYCDGHSDAELEATNEFLGTLLLIPEGAR